MQAVKDDLKAMAERKINKDVFGQVVIREQRPLQNILHMKITCNITQIKDCVRENLEIQKIWQNL